MVKVPLYQNPRTIRIQRRVLLYGAPCFVVFWVCHNLEQANLICVIFEIDASNLALPGHATKQVWDLLVTFL